MSTFDRISNNLRDTVDHLAEGWQEMWNKARNAITRFTPTGKETENHPLTLNSSRWGVLSAEMRETDDSLEIRLEAPGMDPSDFDIRVDHQSLHIRGSKQYESDREDGRFHITERAYGSFERVIPLPCQVEDDSAVAKYKKGVLELELQKHKSLKPRRITVE